MTSSSTERSLLPSFTAPPVQHVSTAIMFEPMPLKSIHMGLLWTEKFRDKYPDAADGPTAVNQVEQFNVDPLRPNFQFQIMQGAPAPQALFQAPTTGLSLGVQHDRLTHVWERAEGVAYPRYPALRSSFERDAAAFIEFCGAQDLGNIAVEQLELSYVNVLAQGQGWERPGELHRVLQPWNPDFSSDLGEPEDVRIAQRYVATRGNDEHYARLHLEVAPFSGPDDNTSMRMTLTFRGQPQEYSPAGIMSFFDDAHERIVRAFAAATTSEMHKVWGRER